MNRRKILDKTSPERDTLQETPDHSLKWTSVKKPYFEYSHRRPLPNKVAQQAIDYINVLTKNYPFQLRYAMAVPLWERFAQAWCDTGDVSKSLRGI